MVGKLAVLLQGRLQSAHYGILNPVSGWNGAHYTTIYTTADCVA